MNTGVRPLAFFAIAADIGAMRRGQYDSAALRMEPAELGI